MAGFEAPNDNDNQPDRLPELLDMARSLPLPEAVLEAEAAEEKPAPAG